MGKCSPWNAEKAERRRMLKGWRPVDNRETPLPDRVWDTGRELRDMMLLSAAEFQEKYGGQVS